MSSRDARHAVIRRRLAAEVGRIDKQAPFRVALAYPSPYRAGMSSLGFLRIYRSVQAEDGMACERAFLDDDPAGERLPPLTYEGLRPLDEFPVIALWVAYELELAGVVKLLEAAGIPPLREARDERHPLILAGGPLTFSNPLPLAAFADAIVMGEADTLAVDALSAVRDASGRAAALDALAALPHVFVPRGTAPRCRASRRATTIGSLPGRRSARRTPSSATCSSSRPSAAARAAAPTA